MSFFDEVGKKISSASQEAIAKTKDFADVAKLNSNISDEEHRITNAYTEIGKMYYESHLENFEECYGNQFSLIKDSMAKIEEYKQKIVDIKGVTKCPKCGAELTKDDVFCTACGTKVKEN